MSDILFAVEILEHQRASARDRENELRRRQAERATILGTDGMTQRRLKARFGWVARIVHPRPTRTTQTLPTTGARIAAA